tara:strand:+ start:314 stop:865 length:552 start_codon:yes stop_codon:yes gene_type:complete
MIKHRNDLGQWLEEVIPSGIGIEVGVQQGRYSEQLLEKWGSGTLYSLDRWEHTDGYIDSANVDQGVQDAYFRETKDLLARYGERSKIIKASSKDGAKLFEDESLDFIYIDADHSYEGCMKDLHLWYPKLRKGGVFAGHDYVTAKFHHGDFGVKQAVDEFFEQRDILVSLIPDPHGWISWFIQK